MNDYDIENLEALLEDEWCDQREVEDREFEGEREPRKAFVEPIYRSYADEQKLYRSCQPECARAGRCAYKRQGTCEDDFVQPILYDLRVRFMPLCLARQANTKLLEWLRFCAGHFLR